MPENVCRPCGASGCALDGGRLDASLDSSVPDAALGDVPRTDGPLLDAPEGLPDVPTDDAPAFDAGPPDAPPVTLCGSVPGTLWCTGFEMGETRESIGYTLGAPPTFSGGTVSIDTSHAFRGARGGFLTSEMHAGGRASYAFVREGLSAPGPSVHATAWIMPMGSPGPDSLLLLQISPSYDGDMNPFRVTVGIDADGFLEVAAGDPDGPGITVASTVTAAPFGEWSCLQLEFSRGNPATVRLSFRETAVPLSFSLAPAFDGVITRFAVGIDYTNEEHAVAVDELAIGTEPQPCH